MPGSSRKGAAMKENSNNNQSKKTELNANIIGVIAQLVEQRACNRNVASSSHAKAYQTFHPSKVDKLVP